VDVDPNFVTRLKFRGCDRGCRHGLLLGFTEGTGRAARDHKAYGDRNPTGDAIHYAPLPLGHSFRAQASLGRFGAFLESPRICSAADPCRLASLAVPFL